MADLWFQLCQLTCSLPVLVFSQELGNDGRYDLLEISSILSFIKCDQG